jgi:hypothetical protein
MLKTWVAQMDFGRSKTQFQPDWLNSCVGISEETPGSETLVSRKGTNLIHAHYYLYVSDYTKIIIRSANRENIVGFD